MAHSTAPHQLTVVSVSYVEVARMRIGLSRCRRMKVVVYTGAPYDDPTAEGTLFPLDSVRILTLSITTAGNLRTLRTVDHTVRVFTEICS